MTDRPILFSGPMVIALLDRRKTQTRRVLHMQPPEWVNFCEQPQTFNVLHQWVPSGLWRWAEVDESRHRQLRQWPVDEDGSHYWLRPKFSAGDRLYVRETVACGACAFGPPSHWAPSFWRREQGTPANPNGLWYAADGLAPERPITDRGTWRPGIHMPRWASRLTLVVTEVRVERLQDISEGDAFAEGVERIRDMSDPSRMNAPEFRVDDICAGVTARDTYATLWDSLNAARGYGWAANPWVVAVTFDVHHANIDTLKRIAA